MSTHMLPNPTWLLVPRPCPCGCGEKVRELAFNPTPQLTAALILDKAQAKTLAAALLAYAESKP